MDEIGTERLGPTAHVTEIGGQQPRHEPGPGLKRHPPPAAKPQNNEEPAEDAEPHQIDSLA
jgi:hypothetical protein